MRATISHILPIWALFCLSGQKSHGHYDCLFAPLPHSSIRFDLIPSDRLSCHFFQPEMSNPCPSEAKNGPQINLNQVKEREIESTRRD